jgi:4-amino-4-deoxy-L-arabinose transferase-like glycosyltransferase
MTTTAALPALPVAPAQMRSPLTASWLGRAVRGPRRQPRWVRPAGAALLVATGLLYIIGLGASGYANEFYAAAVRAGTKSWKALFFGSLDQSNFITVDKPPISLWPAEILGRLFGFNAWTLLLPQALEGVAAVGLLYLTVRRWFGPVAGLLAGALLAVTPVAVLMFRFDNPDALMTMLLVLAAYAVTRAADDGRTGWLLVAGAAMGFDFLTKSLQPFTVLPALALFYFLAAPGSVLRRVGRLLAAGGALVAAAGWWVVIVQLWPASSRPYIGGSGDNTVLGLAFGYNGLSRITGGNGPGGGGGGFGGSTGIGRMFNAQVGTQISWLMPAALIAIVLLVALARGGRRDRVRNAAVLWGGWLAVTGAVFSYAQGIFHEYYTVQLAPAISALVAIGAVLGWRHRDRAVARVGLAAAVGVTAWWSAKLLDRSPDWHPWLRAAILVVGFVVAALLSIPPGHLRTRRSVTALIAAASILTLGGASSAYALNTARTPHNGSIPSAGPAAATRAGAASGPFGGTRNGASAPGGIAPRGTNAPLGQGSSGAGGNAQGTSGAGGATSNNALAVLLRSTNTRWAAATVGDQSAAGLALASGKAVMAIGGWSGSDPTPTLAQFQEWVKDGDIRYFIAGSQGGGGGFGGGPGGGSGTASEIASWVAAHFTAKTVGGQTVYDLTASS